MIRKDNTVFFQKNVDTFKLTKSKNTVKRKEKEQYRKEKKIQEIVQKSNHQRNLLFYSI